MLDTYSVSEAFVVALVKGLIVLVMIDIREKALEAIRFLRRAVLLSFAAGLILVGFGGLDAKANEPVAVKVGAYEYSEVFFYENGQPRGIVPQLIKLLNDLQDDYEFRLVETSSRRRYEDLKAGNFDLVLLDSEKWEWQELDVQFSDPIFSESDLYVALAGGEDPQVLLSNVIRYPILCVLGFHYSFAGFNADPVFLEQNFDVLLRYNEQDVLDGLLAGEAPIGVISAGFLAAKFNETPELRDKLVFAGEPDATYDLVSVLSDSAAISVEQLNQLIEKIKANGQIDSVWETRHFRVSG